MSKHKEIEKHLGGPGKNAKLYSHYVGAQIPGRRKPDEQSRLIYWGIRTPILREAAKAEFSFTELSEEKQWAHWLTIWRTSNIYDVKSVAMIWLAASKRKNLRLKNWRDVVSMTREIDNWGHSDGLSSLLAELLEHRPNLFTLYKKWNRSKNPWLRRQSLVSIYFYARLRKVHRPASESLPLVQKLLLDPHFYVQRAVGWTLREIDRVDSKQQRAFVRKHLRRVSSTAWFATSELYPVKLRKELVGLRKNRD